jgi:PAS domain S-box-containing protein
MPTKTVKTGKRSTATKKSISNNRVSTKHSKKKSSSELFDSVGEAICILSAEGICIDLNKRACTMYGYKRKEEVIGHDVQILASVDKNNISFVQKSIQKAWKGKPQHFEFWAKKKSGEIFLKEIRLTQGYHSGKKIVIATCRDITEQRTAEEALRESEQRFRVLQQASFSGIVLHDHGVILDCNHALSVITGYSVEELIGKDALELIAPEWRYLVQEKIESGYDKSYDTEGIRHDGSRYFIEIQGKHIPYNGKTIQVAEFRDITNRKRSEERIIEQNTKLVALTEQLRRKNHQLEEFTHIVSHNLRSPVGNMVTLINFLENTKSEEEKNQYIIFLKESCSTTLSMLDDLNEVLKIKQNKNIEKQELSFEEIFLLVKRMLNAKITELSADIDYNFSESPTILYPRIYLESILLNLLSNALKYHHPDRKPMIRLKTYRTTNSNLILEVTDNGLGLDLERYGHQIFKLKKTFHKHPESRGVGLYMIKNQIEAMGGEISISSKATEGSTFFVNFNKHLTDGF